MRNRVPYRLLKVGAALAAAILGATGASADDSFFLSGPIRRARARIQDQSEDPERSEAGSTPFKFEVTIHGTEAVKEVSGRDHGS